MDDALDAELPDLIAELRKLGLRGEIADDKLVRLPMDDNVRARILFGRRQTELPIAGLRKAFVRQTVVS